jgi:hypothetical protein
MALTLLEFRADLRLVQNQVHRGDAEIAKGDFSSDPSAISRLDQELLPCGWVQEEEKHARLRVRFLHVSPVIGRELSEDSRDLSLFHKNMEAACLAGD